MCFLAKGHMQSSYDRKFNTMKQLHHKRDIFTKGRAVEKLGESKYVAVISIVPDFFTNIEDD